MTNKPVKIYRFTQALCGVTCSPFLLGGVPEQQLESRKEREPEVVAEFHKSLYVLDDLLLGGLKKAHLQQTNDKAVEILIFCDATFTLHQVEL